MGIISGPSPLLDSPWRFCLWVRGLFLLRLALLVLVSSSASHPARDLHCAPVSNLATLQLVTSPQNSSTARHVHVLVTFTHGVQDLLDLVFWRHLHRHRFHSIHLDEYLDHLLLVPRHFCPTRHVLLNLILFPFLSRNPFALSSSPFFLPVQLSLSSFLLFSPLPLSSSPFLSFFLSLLLCCLQLLLATAWLLSHCCVLRCMPADQPCSDIDKAPISALCHSAEKCSVQTLRRLSARNRPDLWDHSDFLNERQL